MPPPPKTTTTTTTTHTNFYCNNTARPNILGMKDVVGDNVGSDACLIREKKEEHRARLDDTGLNALKDKSKVRGDF